MRCVSPQEAEALFGHLGFSVSLEHAWYRSALILDQARAIGQRRIAAEQPSDFDQIRYLIRDLNKWLPPNRERLLWVDHWEEGIFGFDHAMAATTWRGLGETRTLSEAPGILFDAQNWNEEDQLEIDPVQKHARSLMLGLVSLLMMTDSDGWLISADSLDRIEFWEGNFFFHSKNKTQLKLANNIVDRYGCKRWPTSD
jgi:hypothetical protein